MSDKLKPKQISIRLTQKQAEELDKKASKLGLTKPGYLKHLALNQAVKVKTIVIEKRFDEETMRLLRGIGTNLNQVAAAENLARLTGQKAEVADTVAQIKKDFYRFMGDKPEPLSSEWSVEARLTRAKAGEDQDLDMLVSDPLPQVRAAVADQGRDYDLDRLVSDPVGMVRAAVANQGRDRDLDRLVRDFDWQVRAAVAYQGRDKDLDHLVQDPDPRVRLAVASQGRDRDLEVLRHDPDASVRKAVAGYAY